MSTFAYPITLIGPSDGSIETLEAVVDTGATFTRFPAPTMGRLNVMRQRTVRLQLADGEVVEWDLAV